MPSRCPHLDRHAGQRLQCPQLPAQREPCEEQQVQRVPQPDPGDHGEDAVAEDLLEELRDIRFQEVGGEQQSDQEEQCARAQRAQALPPDHPGFPLDLLGAAGAPARDPGHEPGTDVVGEGVRRQREHQALSLRHPATPQHLGEQLVDARHRARPVAVVVEQRGRIRRDQILGTAQVHDDLAGRRAHGLHVRFTVGATVTESRVRGSSTGVTQVIVTAGGAGVEGATCPGLSSAAVRGWTRAGPA